MQFRACSHVSGATLSMKGRIFQHPITAATVLWHDVQPIRQASYLGSLHQATQSTNSLQEHIIKKDRRRACNFIVLRNSPRVY